jgi:hypothetical protein
MARHVLSRHATGHVAFKGDTNKGQGEAAGDCGVLGDVLCVESWEMCYVLSLSAEPYYKAVRVGGGVLLLFITAVEGIWNASRNPLFLRLFQ